MLKNLTQLEQTVEGKVYHLMCDQDSPLAHVKEALFQFLKHVGQIEDAVAANAPKAEQVAQDVESVVEEAAPVVEAVAPVVEAVV